MTVHTKKVLSELTPESRMRIIRREIFCQLYMQFNLLFAENDDPLLLQEPGERKSEMDKISKLLQPDEANRFAVRLKAIFPFFNKSVFDLVSNGEATVKDVQFEIIQASSGH